MEERRLRVFENRMLRKIFGSRRDKVKGEWRKLHNEELNYLYSSSNIIRVIKWRMGWVGHVARIGERRGEYGDLMWSLLGRHGGGWEDNITMDILEMG
jgi:hypothetical protein